MNRRTDLLQESTRSGLFPARTSGRSLSRSSSWLASLYSVATVAGALHHQKRTFGGTGRLVPSAISDRLHRSSGAQWFERQSCMDHVCSVPRRAICGSSSRAHRIRRLAEGLFRDAECGHRIVEKRAECEGRTRSHLMLSFS
jgi:hypothetical protein